MRFLLLTLVAAALFTAGGGQINDPLDLIVLAGGLALIIRLIRVMWPLILIGLIAALT